jgi:hypothetical protein
MALVACDMIDKKNVSMEEKLANPVEMKAFTLETNLDALAFNLAHLAEHVGELGQVQRETGSGN